MENLRAAAGRAVPKEGTRQLPKPVLQLLLSLACALRREVRRQEAVASENEARAHAHFMVSGVLVQAPGKTGLGRCCRWRARCVARSAASGRWHPRMRRGPMRELWILGYSSRVLGLGGELLLLLACALRREIGCTKLVALILEVLHPPYFGCRPADD